MSPDRREFLAAAAGLAALGALPADAAPGPMTAGADPGAPKHEMRGMWIASVVNIDWPSAAGLSRDAQKAESTALYDLAVARGMNTVVLQVRPTADAFWPSPYEPWSKYLTGTQGEDPGYDPLAFAVHAAHERNLSLHAWFNPYRVSMDTDIAALVPTHPARVHPDWVIAYGGKLYYDPGVPAARRFCVTAILDAVKRYDLDGVHFDDYFYPYPVAGQTFADDDTFATYGSGFTDKAAWRRDNSTRSSGSSSAGSAGRNRRSSSASARSRSGATSPPTRWAPTPRPGHRPTTTSPPTPDAGSARSGSTTWPLRSTGRSA